MMVSPLSGSAAKPSRYNSEAITRLLRDEQEEADFLTEETSFVAKETVSVEHTSSEQQEVSDASVTLTPKQKPEPAAAASCLTGVKRVMKTPKQKAEPVEDLRGKLLKQLMVFVMGPPATEKKTNTHHEALSATT